MDGTMGGTMTPPRDTDGTTEDFAPVIPLRRRQHTPDAPPPRLEREPGGGGIWDPDTPPPSLTARQPPEEPQRAGLTAPVAGCLDAATEDATDTSASARVPRTVRKVRRRRVGVLGACGLVAVAALAVAVLTTGAGRPRPTHLALAPATAATGNAVSHAVAAIGPSLRTHHTPARTTSSSGARPKRSNKAPDRKVAPAARTHRSSSPATVTTPSTTQAVPTTQIASTVTPPSSADQTARHRRQLEAAARRAAAAACVPGELGC